MSEDKSTVTSQKSDESAAGSDVEQFPEHLRTQYTEVDLTCPRCGSIWNPNVAAFVNAKTDPMVRDGVLRKSMHRSRCPACKNYECDINQIWEYYDPDQQVIVQVRPEWEFKAGGGEKIYWDRLERFVLKHAEDDVRVDVVFGFDEMIEKYLGGEEAVEAAMRRRSKEIDMKLNPGTILAHNEHEYFDDEDEGVKV